ncbi:MAG: dihydrodipicolinate synthase family protein [bacterium]
MPGKEDTSGASNRGLPSGIFAAALTPLTDNLKIDHEGLLEHCRWLLTRGCDGVCLFGTTGEAASFTVDERTRALEAVIRGGFPPERLLVGTGCCAVPDTVALTKHATENGAGGVLVLPPFYYKGVSDDGIVEAHRQVLEQIADPRLNVYLYHYPYMSGVRLSRDVISRLTAGYPGVVVGIKDSSGDFKNFEIIRDSFPGLRSFPGTETLLLDGLNVGAAGCISATINVTSPLAAEVYNARGTDDAVVLQKKLTSIRRAFDRFPLIGALKHVMSEHTGRDRWRNVRPPLRPLKREDAVRLEAELESLGFDMG